MGIKDPQGQPQFAAGDFRASKLDKDADSHGIDPERECCECVENTVADENTREGVEWGEVEVGCDVAEDADCCWRRIFRFSYWIASLRATAVIVSYI